MSIDRFRRAFKKLMPSWLTTDEGEKVHFSLGVVMDGFVERARQGLIARFPQHAPSDAFSPLSRDRKITRGIGETDAAYAARLLPWLDDHRVRGNPFALMKQLAAYCNAAVRIRTVDSSGNWFTRDRDGTESYLLAQANWNWDSAPAIAGVTQWSRFWVIIYPTSDGLPWAQSLAWGNGALWGTGQFGTSPTATIGTTATREQVADVRRIVAEWKPEGTKCEWIIIAFDDASFPPGTPAQPTPGPGLWGDWGKVVGTTFVASRISTARYWEGP